ncbi:MAG: CDP-alcohol phosphatidyltransferase family protein [Candidatus Omnitrophica bacterium]|nr:CDP-alcohol phosphatidyltransferase family protein [Candidatus Omnitrophota bacterium]
MMMEFEEFKKKCQKTPTSIWGKYVGNLLATRVSYLLYCYTNVSANTVTWLSFGTGLCAALFFYLGGHLYYVVGAIFYLVSYILDCIDGQLARVRNCLTLFGAWLDLTLDRTLMIILGFALSFSWHRDMGQSSIFIFMFIFISIFLLNLVPVIFLYREKKNSNNVLLFCNNSFFLGIIDKFKTKLKSIGLYFPPVDMNEMLVLIFFISPLFYIVDKIIPIVCVWIALHSLVFTFLVPAARMKYDKN